VIESQRQNHNGGRERGGLERGFSITNHQSLNRSMASITNHQSLNHSMASIAQWVDVIGRNP
jgi:hypothetical protein